MDTVEIVRNKLEALPPEVQQEVLDFVDFLLTKCRKDDDAWSGFSLTSALSGMESDEWPEYREEDFTERWR